MANGTDVVLINTLVLIVSLLIHAYYFGTKIGQLEAMLKHHNGRLDNFNDSIDKMDKRIRNLEKSVSALEAFITNRTISRRL